MMRLIIFSALSVTLVVSLPFSTEVKDPEKNETCPIANKVLKAIRTNPTALDGFNLKFRWQDTGDTFKRLYTKVELGDFTVTGLDKLELEEHNQETSSLSNDELKDNDDEVKIKEIRLIVPPLTFCTETKFGLDDKQYSLHTNIKTADTYHIILGFVYNKTGGVVTKPTNGPKFVEKAVKYNVTVKPADQEELSIEVAKDIQSFIKQNFPSSISTTFLDSFARYLTGLRIGSIADQ